MSYMKATAAVWAILAGTALGVVFVVPGSASAGGLLQDIKKAVRPQDLGSSVEHLDPAKALRDELAKARKAAMAKLPKLEPAQIQRRLQAALNQKIGTGNLQRLGVVYNKSSGTVDLRGTPMGKVLNTWARDFAQGNKREGRLDEFSFNVNSGKLVLQLHVRHCQSWGKSIPGMGPIDLYSVTETARFWYSFRSNSGDFDIDLGPLAPHINSSTYEQLSKGDIIGALESAAPGVIGSIVHYERTNEYAKRRGQFEARYGAGNVYFASKGFVDWATPETAADYIVDGVLTAGVSVYPEIMADLQKRAQQELPALIAWLEKRGLSNAEAAAAELLTGKTPRWPFLKFEMTVVQYSAREHPLGAIATPWRRVNHLAFVIVWQNGSVQPGSRPVVHRPARPVKPAVRPITHRPVRPVVHQAVRPVVHQLVRPVVHQPVRPVVHQPVHQLVRPVVHQPVRPVVHQPVRPVVHQPVRPVTQRPVRPVAGSERRSLLSQGGPTRSSELVDQVRIPFTTVP